MKTILKGLILLVSLLNFSSAYAETVTVWKGGEKLLSVDSYFVDSIAFHKNVKAHESADVIDLGLSVKWASCNLGASKPEELGNLYAWGETSTKTSYGWSDYKYCNGSYNKLTKYVREKHAADYGYNGFFDDKTTLDPDDDAATAALGDKWRMPTSADWRELIDNCDWEWTQINGIYGYKATSTKDGFTDKSLFFPSDNSSNPEGSYWASSLSFEAQSGSGLFFSESGKYLSYGMRCFGTSVRPVTTAAESTPTPSADESGALATCVWSRGVNLLESIATEVDSISFSSVAVEDGDGLVDLGLSVKWASCNLGAAKPEEIGDYFAWGETEVKDLYNWTTYKWGSAKDKLTKYCTKDEYWDGTGAADDKSTLDIEDDAARQILGGSWRIPSAGEWAELHRNCVWLYTKLNGVEGYKVVSTVDGYKDRWIFLPIGGFLGGNGLVNEDKSYYWSSTLYGSEPNLVYYMYTYHENFEIYDDGKANRCSGLNIRPVSK